MTCPGSVRLSRTAPPQIESVHAREGTDAHECLEFIVRRYSSLEGAVREALNRWPREMVEHAAVSAARLFSGDLRPSKMAKLLVETRVVVRGVTHRLFGTLDYAWVDLWGWLVVVDYKYGAGHIVLPRDDDGKPNPQLMLYALGIAEKYNYDFEGVKLAIIQPRAWRDGEDPATITTVKIAELRAFAKEVGTAVTAANHPNAPLSAGEHCRWCPAITTCPENSRSALEAANVVFDLDDGIQAAPSPFTLTPETLPKILAGCDQLETLIKAIRERAFQLAEDGEKIPGYKLVAKRAQRTWLPTAAPAAEKAFGPDVWSRELLSPAQMEKRFRKKNLETFIKKHTASISSGFTLVKESDKRNEVSGAVFDHDD